MGALILIAIGVAAVVAYLYACLFLLAYVTTPLFLVGSAGGLLAGMVVAVIAALRVYAGGGSPEIRTPADVVAGKLPGRVGAGQIRRDLAWPHYFAAQVVLDLIAAYHVVAPIAAGGWAGVRWTVRRVDYRVLLGCWPVTLPALAVVGSFHAGVLLGLAMVSVVVGVVAAGLWTVGLVAVAVLRGVDRCWQVVLRAGGSCPRCYEVSRLPAYQCPGNHPAHDRRSGADLHRDLRPGRLGVLWRQCGCGTRLPTTVFRAALRLQARCPMCGTPLHRGAAVQTDVRIPVFGAASAGKTHFILASLVMLRRTPGAEIELADEHSAQVFQGYTEVFDGGGSAPKTDASQPPVAVTFRLRIRRRRAMVHVFDAAGEALSDPDLNAQFAYLDRARTLAFVLDPFSIPELGDRFGSSFDELFRQANPAREDPELSYQATVMRLRNHGVPTERQRLAFVVSKQDLLVQLPAAAQPAPDGEDSGSLRRWLCDRGLDNLIMAAERDFGEVRYFLVSAQRGATRPESAVTAPFQWLLAGERLAVPAQRDGSDVASPRAGKAMVR